MYINFWYPIGLSEEVTVEAPYRAKVMGLQFVAFRDAAGAAHVLSDTCVHRGGSLSKGWTQNNCVVCPYHGWLFDGEGKCRLIPSIGAEGKVPPRAKVDAYPTQEKYGIVFAFLGDLPEAERPPLYEIEEYGQEGWRANAVKIIELEAYYERSMENGLDPAHNAFVHPSQGAPEVVSDDFDLDPLPFGHKFFAAFESKVPGFDAEAGSGHHGPNTLMTWIQFGGERFIHQYFFEAPVDEDSTRIFFVNTRNHMLEESVDEPFMDINMNVVNEDVGILTTLWPIRTPDSTTKETFMPTDKSVVHYREWLKSWEDKGWRIDQHAQRKLRGDVAVAIPCPARRTEKNWVLDPVPLVAPAPASEAAE